MAKPPPPAEPDTDAAETFAARWSRRKAQSRNAAHIPEPVPVSMPEASPAPEPPAPLTDADLPPLDTLDQDSDYSGFLSPGVSEALRQQALRRLFSSAKFQFRDGLDDYDDDYRSFESLGKTITASMRHRAQVEAQRRLHADGDAAQRSEAGEAPAHAQPDEHDDAADAAFPTQQAQASEGGAGS